MPGLACASCLETVPLPADGRLPPWCPRCGSDFKPAPSGGLAADPADPYADVKRRVPREVTNFPTRPQTGTVPASRPVLRDADDPVPTPTEELGDTHAGQPSGGSGRSFSFGLLWLTGGLLAVCAYLTNSSVEKITSQQAVTGRVVGFTQTRKGLSMPVVSYTFKGQTYKTTGQSGSYAVGDSVQVLVSPESPDKGTVRTFSDLWLGPLITGGLGAACLALSLAGLRGQ